MPPIAGSNVLHASPSASEISRHLQVAVRYYGIDIADERQVETFLLRECEYPCAPPAVVLEHALDLARAALQRGALMQGTATVFGVVTAVLFLMSPKAAEAAEGWLERIPSYVGTTMGAVGVLLLLLALGLATAAGRDDEDRGVK